MSSTQDPLNSEPISQVQENHVAEGTNNQRDEANENLANLQGTETKVVKKTKKVKNGAKAAVENAEGSEKASGVQDEANTQSKEVDSSFLNM